MRSYAMLIRLSASLGSQRARKFLHYQQKGHKEAISGTGTIWIHAASAGEGNQALPLVPHLRKAFKARIIISFFSPSGYDFHKGNDAFDEVVMLPLDTGKQAASFISDIQPVMAIFIRNELWFNYLLQLKIHNIPLFLVNAPDHLTSTPPIFLRKYIHKCLSCFTSVYPVKPVNIEASNFNVCAGDTKWEAAITGNVPLNNKLKAFCNEGLTIVIGSSWKQEEMLTRDWMKTYEGPVNLIIAPHNNAAGRRDEIRQTFPGSVLYSELRDADHSKHVLILDEYGLLKQAYRHADIAVVGGGFGRGIHNILEPASLGIPVLFGPKHDKFYEAGELIKHRYAFCCGDAADFSRTMTTLANHSTEREKIGTGLKMLFDERKDFSSKVVRSIESLVNR